MPVKNISQFLILTTQTEEYMYTHTQRQRQRGGGEDIIIIFELQCVSVSVQRNLERVSSPEAFINRRTHYHTNHINKINTSWINFIVIRTQK